MTTEPDTPFEFVPIEVPQPAPPSLSLSEQPSHRGGVGAYRKLKGNGDEVGVFTVARATQLVGSNTEDRCDGGRVGPVGWHEWDAIAGVCSCGSADQPDPSFRSHVAAMALIEWTDVVFDGNPYGYIIYFEHFDPAVDEGVRQANPAGGLTLQEVFVSMLEWEWAWEHGSTESVAECCHGMLTLMDMPAGVREWLLTEVSGQRVKRFLEGNPDANARGDDAPWFPPEWDDWIARLMMVRCRGYGQAKVGLS
ncbi:hypothetical protein [Gemmatimonas sp.]|uniref:hypothetical protein n=1 Tax=Gemmatimonas sp. TaxID=1962908 RepID=UPI003567EAD9